MRRPEAGRRRRPDPADRGRRARPRRHDPPLGRGPRGRVPPGAAARLGLVEPLHQRGVRGLLRRPGGRVRGPQPGRGRRPADRALRHLRAEAVHGDGRRLAAGRLPVLRVLGRGVLPAGHAAAPQRPARGRRRRPGNARPHRAGGVPGAGVAPQPDGGRRRLRDPPDHRRQLPAVEPRHPAGGGGRGRRDPRSLRAACRRQRRLAAPALGRGHQLGPLPPHRPQADPPRRRRRGGPGRLRALRLQRRPACSAPGWRPTAGASRTAPAPGPSSPGPPGWRPPSSWPGSTGWTASARPFSGS